MNKGLIASGIAALLVTLLVIYWMPSPTRTPAPVIPMPNAYTELVEIGRQIGQVPDNIDEADVETLQAFLDANPEVIPAITEAVMHDSLVPIEYSQNFGMQPSSDTTSVRQAARLLMAEARLAELEGRTVDAATANLNLIALSQKITRGGLLVHMQVGTAYERWAWNSLLRISDALTAEERREFLNQFGSIRYQREPMDAIAERERKLSTATSGRLVTFITRRQTKQIMDQFRILDEEMKQARQSVMDAMSRE